MRRALTMKKTAVGDKYVYENMVKNHFRIGGEQSGHIIFSQYATTGDGILTAIKVMEVLMEKKMPPQRAGLSGAHLSSGAEEHQGAQQT